MGAAVIRHRLVPLVAALALAGCATSANTPAAERTVADVSTCQEYSVRITQLYPDGSFTWTYGDASSVAGIGLGLAGTAGAGVPGGFSSGAHVGASKFITCMEALGYTLLYPSGPRGQRIIRDRALPPGVAK